jgi:hypothetical protein
MAMLRHSGVANRAFSTRSRCLAIRSARCGFATAIIAAPLIALAAVIITGPAIGAR